MLQVLKLTMSESIQSTQALSGLSRGHVSAYTLGGSFQVQSAYADK